MAKPTYTNTSSYQYIQNSLSQYSFDKFSQQAEFNRGAEREKALRVNSELVQQEEDYVKSDINYCQDEFVDLDPESYANENIKPSNWIN